MILVQKKGALPTRERLSKVGKKYKNLQKVREIDEKIARKSSEQDFHITSYEKGEMSQVSA